MTAANRAYASTILTECAIMVSQLVVYRLAALHFGRDGFAEYALARRAISLLQPAVMLGLGIAIPRYIACSIGGVTRSNADGYFAAGLLALSLALVTLLSLFNGLKDFSAFFFFGKAQYRYLILPVSLLVTGLALHTVCEGYFRGNMEMARANLFRFVNLGIMPLAIFPLFRKTASFFLVGMGVSVALSSLLALSFTRFGTSTGSLVSEAMELVRYGLGRVPADLLQIALISFPAVLMAHVEGVRSAGLVAFGTSVLTMTTSLLVPVSTVLLPEASRAIGRGQIEAVRKRASQILISASLWASVIILGMEAFAQPIFKLYLGPSFLEAVNITRILILAALPYSLYLGLKSIIDALSVRSINSRNALISFAALLSGSSAAYFRLVRPAYILVSFVLALYVLGGLTWLEMNTILREGCNTPAGVAREIEVSLIQEKMS